MSKTQKDELRNGLRSRNHEAGGDFSATIVNALAKILQVDPSLRRVLLYKQFKSWGEVDVSSLPKLLSNVEFETVEMLRNAPYPKTQFNAIVVPLVGFNNGGYRLGHGGGWYDKFLATHPNALKIGVGYEDSLVEFKPEAHDVPMHIIITDKRVRFFRTS